MLSQQRIRELLEPPCQLDAEQLSKLREELYALAQVVVDGLMARASATRCSPSDVAEVRRLDGHGDTAISLRP